MTTQELRTDIITHQKFEELTLLDDNFFISLFSVSTLSELMNKIESLSEDWSKYHYQNIKNPDGTYRTLGRNKMKGDLFEIFAECFYKIIGHESSICVSNYTPVPANEDRGVDATALNNEGNQLTISVKFRTLRWHGKKTLTMTDLGQFTFRSQNYYNIPTKTKGRMIVFTTYDGISPFSDPQLSPLITVHGNSTIRYHVDNNKSFWEKLHDMINNTKILKGL